MPSTPSQQINYRLTTHSDQYLTNLSGPVRKQLVQNFKMQTTTECSTSFQQYLLQCKRLQRSPTFANAQNHTQRARDHLNQAQPPEEEININVNEPVPDRPDQQIPKQSHFGVEFEDSIHVEKDLVDLIIAKRYYLSNVYLTEQQKQEFQEIFKNFDGFGRRNLGTLIGMAMLGVIGCIALGFSVIGLIAFGVMGLFFGRYASQRIRIAIKRKQNKFTELDIYEIRMRCLLKWVYAMSIKYKYNVNLLRFIVERLILEIKPALHYRYFDKEMQPQVKQILSKITKLLKQPAIHNSLFLSFKLCQEYWKQLLVLNDPTKPNVSVEQKLEFENALLRTVDNVIKPLNTIIQFSGIRSGQVYELQKEIEQFLIQPFVIQLTLLFPDPQMSIQFIKMFAQKMKSQIRGKQEDFDRIVQSQNFKDIEDIYLLMGLDGRQNMEKQEDSIIQEKLISVQEVEEASSSVQDEQQPHELHNDDAPKDSKEIVLVSANEKDSSSGSKKSDKIVLQIKQHPNRINLQYLMSRTGDQDLIAQSPLKIRKIQGEKREQLNPIPVPQFKCEIDLEAQQQPRYDDFTQNKWNYFQSVLNEPYSLWVKAVEKKEILIYKTLKAGNSSVFVKGEALIRDVPKSIVMRCMCDPQIRTFWDKILQGFEVTDETEYEGVVFFCAVAPIFFIKTREFLQKRIRRENFPKPGQTSLLFYSVEHERFPVKKGHIRVQTDIAGYVFEEVPEGTQMYFVSNNDVKSSVPKELVNYASAKAPFDWFGNLRKISLQLHQAGGDFTKIKTK